MTGNCWVSGWSVDRASLAIWLVNIVANKPIPKPQPQPKPKPKLAKCQGDKTYSGSARSAINRSLHIAHIDDNQQQQTTNNQQPTRNNEQLEQQQQQLLQQQQQLQELRDKCRQQYNKYQAPATTRRERGSAITQGEHGTIAEVSRRKKEGLALLLPVPSSMLSTHWALSYSRAHIKRSPNWNRNRSAELKSQPKSRMGFFLLVSRSVSVSALKCSFRERFTVYPTYIHDPQRKLITTLCCINFAVHKTPARAVRRVMEPINV